MLRNSPVKAVLLVFSLPVIFLLSSCISLNIGNTAGQIKESVIRKGSNDKILVIKIEGAIFDSVQKNAFGFETNAPVTARIKDALQRAEADKSVKAVLLRINSPGGAVTTCDIIRDEIVKFKKRTGIVVIAEMGDIAASGGVYIAVSADKIIAHPTTVTGSIGVIMEMVNAKELFDKIGIKSEVVKSGEKKDMGSPFRSLSPEERVLFQEVNSTLYERFLSVILDGRKNMEETKLRSIADGRIFVADKALAYGLIDQIGYDDDAVVLTEKTAKIKNATIVTYASQASSTSNIYSQTPVSNYGTVNLVNIQMSFLENSGGISFLYMMK